MFQKKGVGTRRLKYRGISRGFAVKSHLTTTQYCQLRRLHGFMQIELILKCEKLLINKLISLFYMETIVLLLPLTIPAQILNHFAFGKAKAAN